MKLVLDLNIISENAPDTLNKRVEFQVYFASKKELQCMNVNFLWMYTNDKREHLHQMQLYGNVLFVMFKTIDMSMTLAACIPGTAR
jgi:hypothetical protein